MKIEKGKIDKKLILKAIRILQRISDKNISSSKDLFDMTKNEYIYLNIVLNSIPEIGKKRIRQIQLIKSIYDDRDNFLFIVSNEYKEKNKEFLKQFKKWKFMSYEKLTKNFSEYKLKRDLLKSFTLFFCERKISPLLKKHLGTKFYEKKKFPFPVEMPENEKLSEFLESLLRSSYVHLGDGPEFTLKIGRVKMNDIEILKNTLTGVKKFIHLLKEFNFTTENLRRIHLKLDKSESLPVFTHLTPEEIKILREIK